MVTVPRTFVVVTVALALLSGCGGGGGGGGSNNTTTYTRGVPVTTALTSSAVLQLPGADDYILAFVSTDFPSGNVTVTANGGGTELPFLATARAAGRSRDLPPALLARRQVASPSQRADTDPAIGSQRTFALVSGDVASVTATLAAKGTRCLLYIDNDTANGAFSAADVADMQNVWDTVIYPVTLSGYGSPSDVDANGRVIALFSPHLPNGIYGYFYPGDIAGGNHADMVYITTPDAKGTTYANLRIGLLATLVHELEHIVIYNHKALVQQVGAEEIWLDEALGFCAEQSCGWLDDPGGPPERVSQYFKSPESFPVRQLSESLPLVLPGLGYLFVRYLGDRFGESIFQRLEQNNQLGPANVTAAAGVPFATLVQDAAAAFYLNETGLSSDPRYSIPSFNTRTHYGGTPTGGADLTLTGPGLTLVNASSGAPAFNVSWVANGLRYLRLTNVPTGGVTLVLNPVTGANLSVVVIRVPTSAP